MIAFGECSFDLFVQVTRWPIPDEKQHTDGLTELPGGQAATCAVGCARLGLRARYLGSIGGDARGETIRAALERERVDARLHLDESAPTRTAVILVDRAGRRTVLASRGPRLQAAPADLRPDEFSSGRLLLVDGTDPEASARAARTARAAGVPTMVDVDAAGPAIEALLHEVDVVIAPGAVIEALGADVVGGALERLQRQLGCALVVATLGAEGSLARDGSQEIRTRPPRVDVVDTTGAGDAFRAGFAAGWLEPEPASLQRHLAMANAVAALNCRALGAWTALPTREELDAVM